MTALPPTRRAPADLNRRSTFGLALLGLLLWMPATGRASEPPAPAPGVLRLMTWNIHHGAGVDGRIDLPRIAAVIRAQHPHVVALNEVDKGVARTARVDMPAELARLTQMTAVFSNNFHFQGGEYGNAILSRLPIRHQTNTHLAMQRPGEQRGLLQARVVWRPGHEFTFMATHLDYRRDNSERLDNVKFFQTLPQQAENLPLFIAGDFNDFPDSPVHRVMSKGFVDAWSVVGHGQGCTFSSERPRSRIDYIWLSRDAGWHPTRAWIPETQASDHLPLVVEFTPTDPHE